MFIFLWSLISPLCLGIVYGGLSLSQKNWHFADLNLGLSIAIYTGYWLLLAALQAAALWWRFQDRYLAIWWLAITAIVGTSVMVTHDLLLFLLLGGPPQGQGIVILLMSLPCLAVIGSLILGAVQFGIVRSRYRNPNKAKSLDPIWLAISFISWIIGFGGAFLSFGYLWAVPIFVGLGTGLKGLFIDRCLTRYVTGDR